MTEDQFQAVLLSSGLTLTAETQREIYDKVGLLRAMVDRVTRPKPRDSEPATIFVADQAS